MQYELTTPCTAADLAPLKAGDTVLLSGVVYTARDQAHKRMLEALDKGEKLPFDLEGSAIYYVGPTPERPGEVIGSAGPTTSGRMDAMSPVSYTHLRAHETDSYLVCRLLLEKKKKNEN